MPVMTAPTPFQVPSPTAQKRVGFSFQQGVVE
jgi:hypothetical protein